MPESRRYKSLKRRLQQLEKHLLPPISPTGVYSAAEYDRVRSYRVLAHAEIESCIEDLAVDAVDHAFSRWMSDGRIRNCVVALVAYHDGRSNLPRAMPPVGGPTNELADALARAKNWFQHYVRTQNHGIREKNVLAVLLPVGVQTAEIDGTWLATIDSFGRDRGETAHASAMKPHTPPDPASERAIITQIVSGLAPIDERIAALRNQR